MIRLYAQHSTYLHLCEFVSMFVCAELYAWLSDYLLWCEYGFKPIAYSFEFFFSSRFTSLSSSNTQQNVSAFGLISSFHFSPCVHVRCAHSIVDFMLSLCEYVYFYDCIRKALEFGNYSLSPSLSFARALVFAFSSVTVTLALGLTVYAFDVIIFNRIWIRLTRPVAPSFWWRPRLHLDSLLGRFTLLVCPQHWRAAHKYKCHWQSVGLSCLVYAVCTRFFSYSVILCYFERIKYEKGTTVNRMGE